MWWTKRNKQTREKLEMKFKAVLHNALLKGRTWQIFTRTKEEAEQLSKGTLQMLTEEERKLAYVKIAEIKEVPVCEIRFFTGIAQVLAKAEVEKAAGA